jgi:hypothetical protein
MRQRHQRRGEFGSTVLASENSDGRDYNNAIGLVLELAEKNSEIHEALTIHGRCVPYESGSGGIQSLSDFRFDREWSAGCVPP